MFWVNDVVKKILDRKDKKYLITDYKTPSGKIHVGSLRGVVVHDALFRGVEEADKKTEYWYGFDDFDPMDGSPEYLPKEFKQYMGLPLCNIPSPVKGYKSYAEYFAKDFENVYRQLGVNATTIWASNLYRAGKYNNAIKIILDNAAEIRKTYQEISGSIKPDDWYAFNVVCPKCGKIGTTRVHNWDGEKVSFVCEPKMVDWAEGCGYEGKISPFDGNGKMPYKVETPSKWYTFCTSVESAGKDHYTKGGSFYVAREIAKNVFKINPAFGFGYEWLHIGGKKMSTSKGVGVSAREISEIISPELLRFLMIRTRPERVIDFNPEGDTIPLLYDEYDRCIDEYLRDPKSDFGQAYHYSKISKNNPPKYRLRFSKVVYLIQMFRTSIEDYAEEEKGSHLTKDELSELKIREKYARLWLTKYAPENYKFEIQEKLPKSAENLDKGQKEFLSGIIKALSEKKWLGDELHAKIHEIKNELKLDPRKAFSAIYLSILDKDSGPQAGWLLASLDRDFVVKRFREVTK